MIKSTPDRQPKEQPKEQPEKQAVKKGKIEKIPKVVQEKKRIQTA